MSTKMLRSAFLQGPTSTIISQGMSVIRKVLATEQFRVSGLTTAEMYKLALKEAPPSNYEGHILEDRVVTKIPNTKSGRKKIPPPEPPHLEHPIRSMRCVIFLGIRLTRPFMFVVVSNIQVLEDSNIAYPSGS